MKLSALIVDDEMSSRENIKLIIEKFYKSDFNNLKFADSIDSTIETLKYFNPDILFLDINLATEHIFNLFQKIDYKKYNIIFVTAYSQHAVDAFKYDAIHYLTKPIDLEEFESAINKVKDKIQDKKLRKRPKKIHVKTHLEQLFLDNEDIVYLEANENYTTIILKNGKRIISSKTIKRYEEILDPDVFYRIHKTYIINRTHHLLKVIKYVAFMSNGDQLTIARRRNSDLLKDGF